VNMHILYDLEMVRCLVFTNIPGFRSPGCIKTPPLQNSSMTPNRGDVGLETVTNDDMSAINFMKSRDLNSR
jgi:hypothetical protein